MIIKSKAGDCMKQPPARLLRTGPKKILELRPRFVSTSWMSKAQTFLTEHLERKVDAVISCSIFAPEWQQS